MEDTRQIICDQERIQEQESVSGKEMLGSQDKKGLVAERREQKLLRCKRLPFAGLTLKRATVAPRRQWHILVREVSLAIFELLVPYTPPAFRGDTVMFAVKKKPTAGTAFRGLLFVSRFMVLGMDRPTATEHQSILLRVCFAS